MASLVSSIAYEALSFIGVHGKSGLSLRDVIFFLEHASIPSRPHLSALALHSIEAYEDKRRGLVSSVLRAVCSLNRGVQLLKYPESLDIGEKIDGFPRGFLSTLLTSSEAPHLFGKIIIGPTDALRRRILGISTNLPEASAELLNLACESRGEGIRKVELHKLMTGTTHNQALIDLQGNMHLVESLRIIDISASMTEDRIMLTFLSLRQSWNRLARVRGYDWHDIAVECSGMPPPFVLRQKILWTFTVLNHFAAKNSANVTRYISGEDVESLKMSVPRFMCMEDFLPYAPYVLAETPFHISFLSRLLHQSMERCYQTHVTSKTIQKSLRKAFEARLDEVGIELVQVPTALLKKLKSQVKDNSLDDSDDEGGSAYSGTKFSRRAVCTIPNNPIIVEIGAGVTEAASDPRVLLFQLEHHGKTPKQIVDFQTKVVTLDTRRPMNTQLAEIANHVRPISMTGFMPAIRRDEKKHGVGRWWKFLPMYPSLEKQSVRELGSKSAETQIENSSRDPLDPVVTAPLLQYPYSRRENHAYDDAAWEDDVAAELDGQEESEEEDLDEYWITNGAYYVSMNRLEENSGVSDHTNGSSQTLASFPEENSVNEARSRVATEVVGGLESPAQVAPATVTPLTSSVSLSQAPVEAGVGATLLEIPPSLSPAGISQPSSRAVTLPQLSASSATNNVTSAADLNVTAQSQPSPYMTVAPVAVETDDALSKRMLQFIRDNTLIPGKNVVTTEQLSAMFYRSQIKKTLDVLSSMTPPLVGTMTVRATSKKLVGAVFLYGETFAPDEITNALKAFTKMSNLRVYTLEGGGGVNTGGRGSQAVLVPNFAVQETPVLGAKRARSANSQGSPGEATRQRIIKRAPASTMSVAVGDAPATIRESARLYSGRKALYWRVRNGWDDNINSRALRMHLEIWRTALRLASVQGYGESATFTLPHVPLAYLQKRMSFSTYCVSVGLGTDLADFFPPGVEIGWDQPIEELHPGFRNHYLNQKSFLCHLLPVLSVLVARGLISLSPPVTPEILMKASSLSLELQACEEFIANCRIAPVAAVRVGSIISSNAKTFQIVPNAISASASSDVYTLTHHSDIATNILDLWYSRWGAELFGTGNVGGAVVTSKNRRTLRRIETVRDTLAKRAANAAKALEEASEARTLVGNEAQFELERELMTMPKRRSRRKNADDHQDSDDESKSDSGEESPEASDSDDSDSSTDEDEDDDNADGLAIHQGRAIKFRRDDYIKEIVSRGTVSSRDAFSKAALRDKGSTALDHADHSSTVRSSSRRGLHLNEDEKAQLRAVLGERVPSAPIVIALAYALEMPVPRVASILCVRPPELDIKSEVGSTPNDRKPTIQNARATINEQEVTKVTEALRDLSFIFVKSRRGFAPIGRVCAPPASVLKALLVTCDSAAPPSPLTVARQVSNSYRGVVGNAVNDLFFRLLGDLAFHVRREDHRSNLWESAVRCLRLCLINTYRAEARKGLLVEREVADGLLDSACATKAHEELTYQFAAVRKNILLGCVAPTAGRLLRKAFFGFCAANVRKVETPQADDDFLAPNRSIRKVEDELLDAVELPEQDIEAVAELIRMANLSDRDRYSPLVAMAVQSRLTPQMIKVAARRKVPLFQTRRASGFQTRLLLTPSSSYFTLPQEYGVDPFMGLSGGEAEGTLEVRSRSGRVTRKAVHTVFNWVMQSTWTGGVNDVTSVVPELFGAESRYQAPLRTTLDLRRTAESHWQIVSRQTEKELASAEEDRGDAEGDDTNLRGHIIVDESAMRASVSNFIKLTPSTHNTMDTTACFGDDENEKITSIEVALTKHKSEVDAKYAGEKWRLPKADTSNNKNAEGYACPARNALAGIDPTGRGVWQNTALFSCGVDDSSNEERRLRAPAKGDLSVFRHLDGTAHSFVVASCVSKVFDIITKYPGTRKAHLVEKVAEDSQGLWTQWHVDTALSFLRNGQYIEEMWQDTFADRPWSTPPLRDAYARTMGLNVCEGEASPFADDCGGEIGEGCAAVGAGGGLRDRFGEDVGVAYHATLHGISQLSAGDGPLHPVHRIL